MAKAKRIVETINVAATGTNYNGAVQDISAYNGVCVQVVGVGSGAGTLTIEYSNDGANWFTLGTATITAGLAIYNSGATLVFSQLLRHKLNMSAGTGDYVITLSAKDLG